MSGSVIERFDTVVVDHGFINHDDRPVSWEDANSYTTEMWQRALGDVAGLCVATEPQRRAFAHGFNGDQISVHHKVRPWFNRGRHTAILLGYPRP